MGTNNQKLAAILKFQKDPNLFIENVLGAELEPYQRKMNELIAEYDRTAISACHNIGKSWDLSRIVLWFGTCFPGSKVITTAPTFNQVKNILWAEIRSGFAKSKLPLGGKMLQTEWQLSKDGDWFALGFTSRNEATSGEGQGSQSSFQGFHAPYILVIFDEATGIPKNMWTMAEGILTSGVVKFVAIGNPTSRSAEFFRCFSDVLWAKLKLTCFDSPNLIANGITNLEELTKEYDRLKSMNDLEVQQVLKSYKIVKPWLLSTSWVMGSALKWGLGHPLFVSKALGNFPEETENTLISLGVCEEAKLRAAFPTASDRRTIGVDVARFGSDQTVITYLHGDQFVSKKAFVKKDTMEVSGEVIAFCQLHGMPDIIVVDGTGIGSGVVDALREAKRNGIIGRNTEIREVQFGAAPKCSRQSCKHINCDKAYYVNIKARMFDLLAQDLKRGLCLPDEDIYLDELPTILYAYDSKGRKAIESKDDYKKRTGRASPDHSDSLALANFGRYDEISIGTFTADTKAPNSLAAQFKGDAW